MISLASQNSALGCDQILLILNHTDSDLRSLCGIDLTDDLAGHYNLAHLLHLFCFKKKTQVLGFFYFPFISFCRQLFRQHTLCCQVCCEDWYHHSESEEYRGRHKQEKQLRNNKMQNLQQMLRQMQGGMGQGMPPPDSPVVDTAEQVYISSLALLKMLKHGTASTVTS